MRLQLFDRMDDTIALLEQRYDYYQGCANELQEVVRSILASNALLGVHIRVKSKNSLREKILRKRLYVQHDNKYDLLNHLSDLIGIRAECRFMREETILYDMLRNACTKMHADGTYSLPDFPNIRFALADEQPQAQKNGFAIYRIDGKYHKNGVTAPFELQIKSLVHVFWAEVEHQLIYKNSAYVLMDDFLKQLLYTNYDSLKQLDHNLQLLYDQMQVRTPSIPSLQNTNMQPIIAKAISDVFLHRMQEAMGFSLRVNDACDILSAYLLSSCEQTGDLIHQLINHIRTASMQSLAFDDALEMDGAYYSEDSFHNAIGHHLSQQLNMDYDWNVFFRMLFALKEGSKIESFSSFVTMYCNRFQCLTLYEGCLEETPEVARARILPLLADTLTANADICILFDRTICRIEEAIRDICMEGCKEQDIIRLCLQCAAEGSADS